MFHWVQGIPFEFNAGAYDNLNMWEQIDNGDQYTPTKKFLLTVPIVLYVHPELLQSSDSLGVYTDNLLGDRFLMSTHYTHYDLTYFTINCLAVLAVVIPKLPSVCYTPFHIFHGSCTICISVLSCPAILQRRRYHVRPRAA